MSMLGLKTLPVNHHLHPFYRILGALVGLVLVALGVIGFLVDGDFVRMPTSAPFCGVCVVAGILLVVAALQGRNAGAEVSAYTGAALILLGLAGLLTMHIEDANFLDVSMANVIVLFVAGMVGLATGFYGRVGEATHQRAARDPDPSARA
jgi:drug/metabolite transporter (DMT)-like permease